MIGLTGIWSQKEADTIHRTSFLLSAYLGEYLVPGSPVFDLGCGTGYYLRALKKKGFKYLVGVEGMVLTNSVFFPVVVADLTLPLEKQIPPPIITGNVICLDVAQYIPKEFQASFLKNISTFCSNQLIMSWSPDDTGYGHVNARSNEYVVGALKEHGFKYLHKTTLEFRTLPESWNSYLQKSLLIFTKQ